MLSKSQAKAFFLLGTGLCGAAFVMLTIDTFQRIPAQTNAAKLTPAVARGKHLFESNNCMGCHTILGEGAYYAPELTKVYERRGEVFIRGMLTDPEKMFPGERKMVAYHFNEQDQADLLAFFQWIGQMDLNGFPARPPLAPPPATVASGPRPAVFNQVCVACHTLGGSGGTVGPVLDGVGSRRDAKYLQAWLENPVNLKPDSKMPKLPLTPEQITELVAFLSQMKEKQ